MRLLRVAATTEQSLKGGKQCTYAERQAAVVLKSVEVLYACWPVPTSDKSNIPDIFSVASQEGGTLMYSVQPVANGRDIAALWARNVIQSLVLFHSVVSAKSQTSYTVTRVVALTVACQGATDLEHFLTVK